mmetsp:Transcript_29339/g.46854  ORF Transcript_29339/g.46854 Transcript_29339/m.46854 type:complete len:857 (+) Transcript_29339:128-2698(+)
MAKKGQKQKERRAANANKGKQRQPSPKASGKASSSDKAGSGGHRGLQNLGNTCFLNSILQCLNVSNPFAEEFMELGQESLTNGSVGVSLCSVFKGIRGQDASKGSVSPKPLLQLLRSRFPWYRGNEQQDAHELLRNLLGTISDETTKEETRRAKEEGKAPPRPPGAPVGICEQMIWNNFRGYFATAVLCWGCARVSLRLDPFLDISLELPRIGELPGPLGVLASVSQPVNAKAVATSKASSTQKSGSQKMGDVKIAVEAENEEASNKSLDELAKEAAQFAARLYVLELTKAIPDSANLADRKRSALRKLAIELGASGEELEKGDDCDDKEEFIRLIIKLLWPKTSSKTTVTKPDADTSFAENTPADDDDAAAALEIRKDEEQIAEIPGIVEADDSAVEVTRLDVDASEKSADAKNGDDKSAESREHVEAKLGDDETSEASEPFEVVLSRETTSKDGGRWGFEWNKSLIQKSLVIDAVVEDSPLDKWNLKRQTVGQIESVVVKGDRLIEANGCDSRQEILKVLKDALKVTLVFVHEASSAKQALASCAAADEDDDNSKAQPKKGKKGKKARDEKGSEDEKEDPAEKKRREQKALEEREARRVDFCEQARKRSEALPEALRNVFGSGCLQVGKADERSAFADCLQQFSRVEALEEDFAPSYECTDCCQEKGSRRFASRRVWFWSPPPPLLTVQLKRFVRRGVRYEKSTTTVETPAVLDLTPFMLTEAEHSCLRPHFASDTVCKPPTQSGDARYELYGVCVHLGQTMQSGHYIAYVNAGPSLEKEKWYNISDAHVSKCSRQDALQAAAYVAFYRREGLVPQAQCEHAPDCDGENQSDSGDETSSEAGGDKKKGGKNLGD